MKLGSQEVIWRQGMQVPAAAQDTNALDALIAAASSRKGVATKTEAGCRAL